MPLRFLIFLGLIGLAEYYTFVVLRSTVRGMSVGWRATIFSVYGLITAVTWLGFLLFRQINWAAMPHMVRNIYIAFVLGFLVGKILIMFVMVIDDLRRLVLWIVQFMITNKTAETPPEQGGISRSVFLTRLALGLGITALAGFLYGVTNRYNYHIKRVKLRFANLPEAFRGMKIVQISDIHSGSFDDHEAVEKGVLKVLNEKPDIILFTGDLVNNKAEEIEPFKDIFSKLQAPYGVYSILGNHDYGDYVEWPDKANGYSTLQHENLERLKQHQIDMGWKLMMNEHVVLEKGTDKIALIGIENWSAKAQFPKYGKMALAYQGLPEKKIPFKILMSHDPSHWDAQVRPHYSDIDLTLSGHTHGMQFGVEIPGLKLKWSPVKYVYQKWAGLYREHDQFLYVNRGYGFLGYPGRLGIMPEITVIELI